MVFDKFRHKALKLFLTFGLLYFFEVVANYDFSIVDLKKFVAVLILCCCVHCVMC
jgi:hypothetical protein